MTSPPPASQRTPIHPLRHITNPAPAPFTSSLFTTNITATASLLPPTHARHSTVQYIHTYTTAHQTRRGGGKKNRVHRIVRRSNANSTNVSVGRASTAILLSVEVSCHLGSRWCCTVCTVQYSTVPGPVGRSGWVFPPARFDARVGLSAVKWKFPVALLRERVSAHELPWSTYLMPGMGTLYFALIGC